MQCDVLVIGGGHAGIEAAHAAARMGLQTTLVTLSLSRVGFMSCNPAMGGLAKGQLVKEIDALGGVMGRLTDQSGIQFRRLNTSKGPAVRSSRAQCDKRVYSENAQKTLSSIPHLNRLEAEVSSLVWKNENGRTRISGVRLGNGSEILARSVVITSGTFMRALMFTGFDTEAGGRAGDQSSNQLSDSIEQLGIKLKRLKTGTPPRLHKNSINYKQLERQGGDEKPIPFSFYQRLERFPYLEQMDCFITYTNKQTHEIIEENFNRSPMFTGMIQGLGPRYCPSIEDKVKKFSDKDRHQLYLEPEGHGVDEIYVNGISTSLPRDVQEKFVRSIVGLESAEFIRFGYAVEYDAIDARVLKATLESKDCEGLYFAGQVNGTSGYEEAGAQGLVAGINAALKCLEQDPFVLDRTEGYIGVLVDDLILKGADEPYRMFTSRAENRLHLREDNADVRLASMGHRIGLLNDSDYALFEKKMSAISKVNESLRTFYLYPSDEKVSAWLSERGNPVLRDRVDGVQFLKRPEVNLAVLRDLGWVSPEEAENELGWEESEIQVKYDGYIRRDQDLFEGVKKSEALKFPAGFDFDQVPGLSTEIKSRLRVTRPETVGQMSRMTGMTPAAVANVVIYMKMQDRA